MLDYMENYRYCKKHNIKTPMSYEMANLYLNLGYEIIVKRVSTFSYGYIKLKKGERDIYGVFIPLRRSDIREILTLISPIFLLEKCYFHTERL